MARFPRTRNWRPLLETLEDRTLLSTSTLPDLFAVSQARALSKKHVEIQFSQPAGTDIDLPEDFAITGRSGQTLRVKGVDVSADRTSAVLTTGNQQSRRYHVGLAASASSARFAGSTLEVGVLVNAAALDNTTVVLRFSKQVTHANDLSSYTLSGGLVVQSAVKAADGKTVTLTTSPQDRVLYTVNAAGVRDSDGKPFDPSTRTFVGIAFNQDQPLPRVSSAGLNFEYEGRRLLRSPDGRQRHQSTKLRHRTKQRQLGGGQGHRHGRRRSRERTAPRSS